MDVMTVGTDSKLNMTFCRLYHTQQCCIDHQFKDLLHAASGLIDNRVHLWFNATFVHI